jgi:hypothetical protein
MKTFVCSFGPPSPANIREGSSPALLKGYKPAVNGYSPGTFSCKHQRRISPQALYFGKAIFGFENEKVIPYALAFLFLYHVL